MWKLLFQGGSVIRLFHKELEAFVVAEGLFDDEVTEDGNNSCTYLTKLITHIDAELANRTSAFALCYEFAPNICWTRYQHQQLHQTQAATKHQMHQILAAPNIRCTRYQLHQTSATPNISCTRYQLHQTSAKQNISNTKYQQHQPTAAPNNSCTKQLLHQISDVLNTQRYPWRSCCNNGAVTCYKWRNIQLLNY